MNENHFQLRNEAQGKLIPNKSVIVEKKNVVLQANKTSFNSVVSVRGKWL